MNQRQFADDWLQAQVMTRQPMPVEARKVFQGEIFSTHQWQQAMYDGSTATFEKLSRATTVGIVPVTQEGSILITRQEQPSIAEFTGLVGGVVDPGEEVYVAAQRELLEETGYVASDWVFWYGVQPVSKIDWNVYVFVALGCQKKQAQQLDAGEKIEVLELSFDELLPAVTDASFRDRELTLKLLEEYYHDSEMRKLKSLLGL